MTNEKKIEKLHFLLKSLQGLKEKFNNDSEYQYGEVCGDCYEEIDILKEQLEIDKKYEIKSKSYNGTKVKTIEKQPIKDIKKDSILHLRSILDSVQDIQTNTTGRVSYLMGVIYVNLQAEISRVRKLYKKITK